MLNYVLSSRKFKYIELYYNYIQIKGICYGELHSSEKLYNSLFMENTTLVCVDE